MILVGGGGGYLATPVAMKIKERQSRNILSGLKSPSKVLCFGADKGNPEEQCYQFPEIGEFGAGFFHASRPGHWVQTRRPIDVGL